MTWTDPDLLAVPVPGGELIVGRWGEGRHVVLASHGITANHRSFGEVAAQLAVAGADVTLLAVDHRGRGGSAQLPGPYGLGAHADDLIAVLDHVGVEAATLVGHSMGAYIAALAAERAPGRVTGLVLVDGGLSIDVDLPPDTDIEQVVRAVIGPALERLDRTFASPEAYVDFWRAHPAVGGEHFTDVAEAYVRYDLVETDDGAWRSPVVKAAVLDDGRGLLHDGPDRSAMQRVRVPTSLLWAPRGMLDQEPGLLPPEVVATVTADLGHVSTRRVEDVNHYTIVLAPAGAAVVAEAVVDLLNGPAG